MNQTQPPAPKRAGRPPYRPSPEDRLQVSRMHSCGLLPFKIAAVLDISLPTLRKHFRDELAVPTVHFPSLFDRATRFRDVSAAIFWAKTRCRFSTSSSRRRA